jgi:hypothetical protein
MNHGASSSSPTIALAATSGSIAEDILYGADSIAAHLYGNSSHRRKVYNLVETERLPHFRLGAMICARKSILLNWIETQEARNQAQRT